MAPRDAACHVTPLRFVQISVRINPLFPSTLFDVTRKWDIFHFDRSSSLGAFFHSSAFPLYCHAVGENILLVSDRRPTIEFSIFTSALRQSMKRVVGGGVGVGGCQVVLLLLLGTAELRQDKSARLFFCLNEA